jgi:hypothetical protein
LQYDKNTPPAQIYKREINIPISFNGNGGILKKCKKKKWNGEIGKDRRMKIEDPFSKKKQRIRKTHEKC